MKNPSIEVLILDDRLRALGYATPGACACDLRAMRVYYGGNKTPAQLIGREMVRPKEVLKIGTGVAVHIGSIALSSEDCFDDFWRFAGLVLPRSGLGTERRIRLANTAGLIDSDYQGEIILSVENGGSEEFWIEPEMRLAQMVITPVLQANFLAVPTFSAVTARGIGGFGSTGVA